MHDPTYVAATLSNPDAVSVRAALHVVGAAQAATFDVLNQRARASYALVTPRATTLHTRGVGAQATSSSSAPAPSLRSPRCGIAE